MTVTWDILVASIEHRHEGLERLLKALDPQMRPGVGVLVYRDNLEASIGTKRQRLLEASEADYVSFCDDDDMVPPYHVARILRALSEQPDYVGWRQRYTHNGILQQPVFHTLHHCGEWWNDGKGFYRGITHFNQIRRDLALLARFDRVPGAGEDYSWSQELEATGKVRNEVYIDDQMHIHQELSSDGFHTPRVPLTEHPPFLDYPFVRYIDAAA